MLPRTLYGSQCVLHYIHSSCPQRHVSLPLAQVLSVEASLVLCRAAEWETTQLSTHDHVDQGPHKQKKQTKHSVKTEKSESDASTACSDFYKAEAFLCLLSTQVTEVGISSIRCPAISLREGSLFSHCKTQNWVTLKMFALQLGWLCQLFLRPFPNLKYIKKFMLKYIFIHSFLNFLC